MNIGVIVGVFYDFQNSFCQVNLYTENLVAKERKYKNLTSYWGQNESYTVKSWKIQTHKVTDTIYTLKQLHESHSQATYNHNVHTNPLSAYKMMCNLIGRRLLSNLRTQQK